MPTPDKSISSSLMGNVFAGPSPPEIEGIFYRISTKVSIANPMVFFCTSHVPQVPKYYDDAIVLSRNPRLYRLTDGDIVHVSDRIPNKRIVGGWCRWPNVSGLV